MINSSRGKLKPSFMCSKEYRQQFANSIAQMTISVGQTVHENERLHTISQLINRSFGGCKIMIDDSIQWYTLAIGLPDKSPQELLQMAIAAGDDYLARNQPYFEKLFTIPYEIIRWKDWLHTPAWQEAIQNMYRIYEECPPFQQAIDQNVQTFLSRYEKNHATANYDRNHAIKMCTHYLLEECGVMKEIWPTLGCHFEVYPSGRNQAMQATYQLFIEPYTPHLLRSVAIRFNRLKIKVLA